VGSRVEKQMSRFFIAAILLVVSGFTIGGLATVQSITLPADRKPQDTTPPSPKDYCWNDGGPIQGPSSPPTPFLYQPFSGQLSGDAWTAQVDHITPTYARDGVIGTLGEKLAYSDHRPAYDGDTRTPLQGGTLAYGGPRSYQHYDYTTPPSQIPYHVLAYESPSFEMYMFYDGHDGHDFAISGDALAAAAGTVVFAGDTKTSLGRVVEIYHPEGYLTRYAHLARIDVEKGEQINTPGKPIGQIGGSAYRDGAMRDPPDKRAWGVHLHFSVFRWNPDRQQWQITDPFGWDPWQAPHGQTEDPLVNCNGEISYVLWFSWWPTPYGSSQGIAVRPTQDRYVGGWLGNDIILAPGTTSTIVHTISTPQIPVKPDIVLLADTTTSMGPYIENVKANASRVITEVRTVQQDAQFGVAEYKDFTPTGCSITVSPFAYKLNQAVTADDSLVQAGVNSWSLAGGSCDTPEDNLNALYQVATSPEIGWRNDATRIIAWFGDAPSHDPSNGYTLAQINAALTAANIRVIAVDARNLDGCVNSSCGQATEITSATNGKLLSLSSVAAGTTAHVAAPPPLEDDVAGAILEGLQSLPVTVEPQVSGCEPYTTVTFDATSKTAPSGEPVSFTTTIAVAEDVPAGTAITCQVDFLLDGKLVTDPAAAQPILIVVPADAELPPPSPQGGIVFASDREGNFEIYVMEADGSNQVRLTNDPADDREPAWSPDGSKIAFRSYRGESFDIYVMDADGSNQIRLTDNPADDGGIAWSPDGSEIAFTSSRDGNDEVYVMKTDGSNQINISRSATADLWPSWSPVRATSPAETPPPEDSNNFIAQLDGNQEVPPRETEATGEATFQLRDETQLDFTLNLFNIQNIVAAHIHCAPAGENAAVGITLYGPVAPGGGAVDTFSAGGSITAPDAENGCGWADVAAVVEAMRSGNAYVNIHTDDGVDPLDSGSGDFPGGEIRGQIEWTGD
jgi:murein DD-endopeptidase MepM/ murein hydrolase activator NlpD